MNLLKSGMILNMLLSQISNECAPMKTRRLKNRSNPWIDGHILQMMYKRDYVP